MKWMKVFKQGLNCILVIFTLFAYSQPVIAKKVEPEKQVMSVNSKKSVEKQTEQQKVLDSNKVNINQAGIEELAEKLNGIGIQKAKAIVEYREKYGAFNSLENILEVSGIGPAFLEKNRDKLIL
ncbi:ComEA family DNA-binding protein [Providencia sneebia]|uniref:Competence protein ComEA n=1 Tax=Providencia sneebia DSM 19967 TaxID=1141660 RepID=K8W132_9GAMM|nr:ComEA family DNA-binding protein [Providencia sneebia]EKT53516.1 hypothetical protein OO7_14929 [Providencia sneebia DSM 19967]